MSLDEQAVRIFIGSSSNGEDAEIECAYEYSLRQNCSKELDIVWMRQSHSVESWWGAWMTQEWSRIYCEVISVLKKKLKVKC